MGRTRPDSDRSFRIETSTAWDNLVVSGRVSTSQRAVIERMARNEGRFDSVQSYDDQIVTLGAMQKTVNPQGAGELPRQVYAFSLSNPTLYRRLFVDRGWTVALNSSSVPVMYFNIQGRPTTGLALNNYIKDPARPQQWQATLDPLMRAGRNPNFQAQQITDFVARLNDAMAKVPTDARRGYRTNYAFPISAYVTSEKAAALVLDQDVNRPGHTARTFAEALDRFFANNPTADRNPSRWSPAQRTAYETQIVNHYVAARDDRQFTTMSHASERADFLMRGASPLSGAPGSYIAPRP